MSSNTTLGVRAFGLSFFRAHGLLLQADPPVILQHYRAQVDSAVDLASDTSYEFVVVWIDQHGNTAPPATGTFSTGLLHPVTDWSAFVFLPARDGGIALHVICTP